MLENVCFCSTMPKTVLPNFQKRKNSELSLEAIKQFDKQER